MKIEIEHYPSDLPKHDPKVAIYTEWGPLGRGEPSMRGFLTLTVRGEKKDLGIVSASVRSPRLDESRERFHERMALAFANAVADKIEPILFPKEDKPAP